MDASFSTLRAAIATRAPLWANANAMARPIPCDAPVTRATFSRRENIRGNPIVSARSGATQSAETKIATAISLSGRAERLVSEDQAGGNARLALDGVSKTRHEVIGLDEANRKARAQFDVDAAPRG